MDSTTQTGVDERQRLVAEQSAVQLDEAANVVAGYGLTSLAAIFRRQATEQRRALASRPQEQPRKATGEQIEAGAKADARYHGHEESAWPAYKEHVRHIINAALSVSPAAAQGWQPRETAPKNGTLEWRVLMHWRDMGSSSGWTIWRMTHWRPAALPAPAALAPEQEELTEVRVRQIIGEYMHPKGA